MGLPVSQTEQTKAPEPTIVQEDPPKPAPKPVKVDDNKEKLLEEARKQYFIEKQQAAERNKNLILEQKGISPAVQQSN